MPRCLSREVFQAQLLGNQEGASANTERYVFGKLSARRFQTPTFCAPTRFQLWRDRARKSTQGSVMSTCVWRVLRNIPVLHVPFSCQKARGIWYTPPNDAFYDRGTVPFFGESISDWRGSSTIYSGGATQYRWNIIRVFRYFSINILLKTWPCSSGCTSSFVKVGFSSGGVYS